MRSGDVGSAYLGSSTAVLVCGCAKSHNMASVTFETNALHLCMDHLLVPEVLEAKVKDVWQVILAHDVCTDETKELAALKAAE